MGPAQALYAWRSFVGLVEGNGALERADADAEVVGEIGEDGVVVAGAGGELFRRDALADGPVAFGEGLGGSAFRFLFAFPDDAAEVGEELLVLAFGPVLAVDRAESAGGELADSGPRAALHRHFELCIELLGCCPELCGQIFAPEVGLQHRKLVETPFH